MVVSAVSRISHTVRLVVNLLHQTHSAQFHHSATVSPVTAVLTVARDAHVPPPVVADVLNTAIIATLISHPTSHNKRRLSLSLRVIIFDGKNPLTPPALP